jgi:hypothetical protein
VRGRLCGAGIGMRKGTVALGREAAAAAVNKWVTGRERTKQGGGRGVCVRGGGK